ncbi:DUF2147 domain-containing protein [Enterovirga rhinocerotis]|uniref:Uncharacterized protein (DUF2147 family) n=1 Tax=Enterovirga rhinocerotis TaxID=1339210 RepID=A0A4R7C5N1_9HYPH|nr:DUF2147 domain-containing protein [Enterovirga rhinocerotis]TDR93202.1 uncharacterized protein (DUF2147 family) [Enterovirga rhinocerotis]
MRGSIVLVLALFGAVPAVAADPILGSWRNAAGWRAVVRPCSGQLCITLRSGPHAGTRIGNVTASGDGRYSGTVVDPATGRAYRGWATLSGRTVQLTGCLAGTAACRTETWTRR